MCLRVLQAATLAAGKGQLVLRARGVIEQGFDYWALEQRAFFVSLWALGSQS